MLGWAGACAAHRWRQLKPQVPPRLLRLAPRRKHRREAIRARAAAAPRSAAPDAAPHAAPRAAHLFEAAAIGEEGVEHRLHR